MTEARRLQSLARLGRRRRLGMAAVRALAVGLLVAAPLRFGTGSTALALVVGTVAALMVWYRLDARARRIDARAVARFLDGRFGSLADSTELLLPAAQAPASLLMQVQRERTTQAFRELDGRGELTSAMPPFPAAAAAGWLGAAVALAVGLAALELRGTGAASTPAAGAPSVVAAEVKLAPQRYTGAAPSVVKTLDFDTHAAAQVRWTITLSAPADAVSLAFHTGEQLALEATGGRTWRSAGWPAFATAYRIIADGEELHGHFHRVSVVPDEPPVISVSSPNEAVELLPPAADRPTLKLALSATDDYGLVSANARVTLARGTGEQVRFREKSLPLSTRLTDDRRSLSASETLDLMELGMERGDELFVFAEVTDNRPESPNVATTSTYIVRWPADDVMEISQVSAVAVNVLPEYFRSQRQIIIDTEALLAEREAIDPLTFAERAQGLAIDQKMLRLRYGQFLGEEAQSTLVDFGGAATDDAHEEEHGQAEGDARGDGQGAGHNDGHDDSHAGHEEAPPDIPAFGDAAAAIAPYAHLHDTAEHATLFDPATRDLLKSALAQMWQAELELRLAEASAALPFEYRALELIKRVQHSSRIYLRRTGFQPTPVDESRRLTGELDDIEDRTRKASDSDSDASETSRLRGLFEALNQPYRTLPDSVSRTAPLVRQLAARDSQWLDALRAIDALQADPNCRECAAALSGALWRGLDRQVAVPGGGEALPSPLTRAFKDRALAQPLR